VQQLIGKSSPLILDLFVPFFLSFFLSFFFSEARQVLHRLLFFPSSLTLNTGVRFPLSLLYSVNLKQPCAQGCRRGCSFVFHVNTSPHLILATSSPQLRRTMKHSPLPSFKTPHFPPFLFLTISYHPKPSLNTPTTTNPKWPPPRPPRRTANSTCSSPSS
jgi:hypothetical protein